MSTTVLSFPVKHRCPACDKPIIGPDDLSECYTCGDRFCRRCHVCSCDKFAEFVKDLLKE
jgi:hypothetical protein